VTHRVLILAVVLAASLAAIAERPAFGETPPREQADAAGAQAGDRLRTFYVDAMRGDDGGDGLTPETAWRSLDKVNKAPLRPGDRVLFRRGGVWRGQLVPQSGSADGAITYGAFGEGPKPALLGSVARDRPEDWQPAGEGIWATVPVRFDPRETVADLREARWSLHCEGGAQCTLAPSAADAGVGPGYRVECKGPGARANHVQLSAGGFGVREADYYVFTFRARCSVPFTPAAIVVLKSRPPWTGYASPMVALPQIGAQWVEHEIGFQARQTADDARLTLYLGGAMPAGASLDFQPGKLVRATCNQPIPLSIDVGNVIFDHGAAVGVKKWNAADLREEGDYFYDGRLWQVKLRAAANPATRHRSIELALRRHVIDQGGRGYVTYENLAIRYGAAHGIGGYGTHHVTVRDCDVSYVGGGHQFTTPGGRPVRFGNGIEFWADARDCLVEGCRLWEIYDAALTNQGSGTNVQENITYRRNVIWNCEYSFEYWNRDATSRTRHIRFEHNTCVDAGHGWGHGQRPDPNGRHVMFYSNTAATEDFVVRYNIFSNATESCLRLHGPDWTAALTMDANCWFQPEGPILVWGAEKVGPKEFAAFGQQHGFDAHWRIVEPKFVDPARRDYRLAPDSPARAIQGDGQPVGAVFDEHDRLRR